ncbi:hypothetical protein [Levilactobacillus humaensis]|uniref:hypothetical protein n=1 Tax=Levilactobacillus humaensis TaxID=2950375 RepID=UPI0021C27B99|nr:hypothetical protein [Levilactobacillus humaensis]
MLKKNIDLNQYLADQQIYANLLIYDYSQADAVVPENRVTLLSPERRRLTQRGGRYQLYNNSGDFYVNGLTLADLNRRLPEMMASDQPQVLSTEEPHLDIVADLIRQVAAMGLVVTGSRYVCERTWTATDDRRLMATLLSHRGCTVQAGETPGSTIMVDEDQQPVMREEHDGHDAELVDDVRFTVQDRAGHPLIRLIPLDLLGTVLYGLRCGFSAHQLQEWLLWPRLDQSLIGSARLALVESRQTPAKPITSLADLRKLNTVSVPTDRPITARWFQFTNAADTRDLGGAMAPEEASDVLEAAFHGDPRPSDREFSDWLVRLAACFNLQIQRRQRRRLAVCDVDQFKVENGEIEDLEATSRANTGGFPETVYEIFDREAGLSVCYDLSFRELVPTLLALVAQHKIILSRKDS